MATVKIFESFSSFKRFLGHDPSAQEETVADLYISSDFLEPKQQAWLEQRNIKSKVFSKNFSEEEREQFLKEYVDLIGAVSAEQNSLLWWATDISSKNRFTSRLLHDLQIFWMIMKVVESQQVNHFYFVITPHVILSALAKALNEKGNSTSVFCHDFYFRLNIMRIALRQAVGALAKFVVVLFRWLYAKWHLTSKLNAASQESKEYYVIKSFLFPSNFNGKNQYRDMFFGSLPEYIAKQKKVVFFVNILGSYRKSIQEIKQCKDTSIFPYELFLSFTDIVKGFWQSFVYTVGIKDEKRFFNFDVKDIINNTCRLNRAKIQVRQFLHYASTKRFLANFKVETFLTTFENNPWEKMCFAALREISPETKILGYQHTVVPQSSVNMFTSHLEEKIIPQPDLVLTVGKIPQEIIARYETRAQSQVVPSCGLRFEYLFEQKPQPRRPLKRILVGLEGIFEVYHLVNYVIRQLANHPEFDVVIRTHPVLPPKKFAHKLDRDLSTLEHFSVSKNVPLMEDLSNSDCVIYWGSTLALEALSLGKPVVHYDMGSILKYDCLFGCPFLKWTVNEESPLENILDQIRNMNDNIFQQEVRKAQVYIFDYFSSVNDKNMQIFLNLKNFDARA